MRRREFLRSGLVVGGGTLLGAGVLWQTRTSAGGQTMPGMGGGTMGGMAGMTATPAAGMGGMPGMPGMSGMPGMPMADDATPNVTSALPVQLFQRSLPLPAELAPSWSDDTTDYFTVTMRPAQVEVVPGTQTTIWGFEGQYPGPTIRARRGRRAIVQQVNGLDVPSSTHLHGGHVAPEMDGHPMDLVQPGQAKEYEYPNQQPGATLWYHDHSMDATGPQVYMGLAGFYLIEDESEAALNLPSGAYDVPLVIQDRAFNADGSFTYADAGNMPVLMNGLLADTILVNGAPWPYFQVAARKYRIRLLNGSNARHYMLALDNGEPLVVIAGDGGLLDAPVPVPVLSLAPAERYEVIIDFSSVPVGGQVVLQNQMGVGDLTRVLRFDVVRVEDDPSTVPSTLRSVERLNPAEAVQTRDWTLNMQMGPGVMGGAPWVINGQLFDAQRIDARPALDSVEIWQFTNPSAMMHPMHIHDVMFQLLDRNGAPPAAHETGWKDTVDVPAGETVRVITRFTDFTGTYVFHCHNLEHEDRMMMAQFQVV